MFSITTTPEKADDLEAQQNLTVISPSSSVPHSRTSTFLAEEHPSSVQQQPAQHHLHDSIDEKRTSSGSASTLAPPEDDNDVPMAHTTAVVGDDDDEKKAMAKESTDRTSSAQQSRPAVVNSPPSIASTTSSANSESPDLPPGHGDKAFQVTWSGPTDPANPQNWTRWSRWYYTVLGSLLVFNATFASSSPGGIVRKVMEDFTFGTEVATLMISLFLAGYCVGPLFWGPLSEIYGRKPIFVVSFLFYTGFQVGCALAPNTGALLVFRFLGGCAASSPLANAGALMGDIWDQRTRGKAVALFTLAPFAGPALGPVVGGFIGASASASWRWLFWVLTIFAGGCLALIVFTLPETYAPVILKGLAEKKRKETGDERWWAPIEVQMRETTIGARFKDVLTKPVKMLFFEPMLLAITVYMSFVYGCLYLLFEAYPIVFEEGHGFNSGEDGLAFIPLFVGGIIGTIISVFFYNPRYVALLEKHAPHHPPPESRLPMGVIGGVIFAVGFFWFGWTSFPSVSYWAPLLSGLAFGISLMFLFLSLLNYIIDTYLHEAASALSANTIVRSMFGASFPLFATQMFRALNPRWASTLLGCVAVVMIPIPVLFIKYGPALRKRSRYSPTA